MPAGGHPQAPRQHEAGSIQSEGSNSSPPYGGHSLDLGSTLGPSEMVLPLLMSWIEDADSCPGFEIAEEKAVALVLVARRAGQPQIVLYGGPTERSWEQMIDLHQSAGYCHLGQAVATAVSSLLRHTTS